MGLCQAVPLRVGPTVSGQRALAWFSPASGTETQSRFCSGQILPLLLAGHRATTSRFSPHQSKCPGHLMSSFQKGRWSPGRGGLGPAKDFTAPGQ